MKQLFYRFIYSPPVNFVLRNINKFLSPVFPRIKLPVSGTMRLKLRSGGTISFTANQSDFVSYLVFWNGLYSYEYVGIFEEVIRKCNGFVDIGANAGLFSLIAAKANPSIAVLAFDPSIASSYYLNLNVKNNGLQDRIHIFNAGVSDTTAMMDFFEVKNPKYSYLKYNLGGSSSLEIEPEHHTKHRVKVWAFDDILHEKFSTTRIDFVKIDAEGAEPKIIDGMKKCLIEHQPILVCEILFNDIRLDLMSKLNALGYQPYLHVKEGLLLIEELPEVPDEHRNCFFVTDAKKALIEKFIVRK